MNIFVKKVTSLVVVIVFLCTHITTVFATSEFSVGEGNGNDLESTIIEDTNEPENIEETYTELNDENDEFIEETIIEEQFEEEEEIEEITVPMRMVSNNDFSSAIPVEPRGSITGEIDFIGDIHWFTFVSSDKPMTFITHEGDIVVELYDEQETLLLADTYGEYYLTNESTYYIKVYNDNNDTPEYLISILQLYGNYAEVITGDVTITNATTHTSKRILYTGNVTVDANLTINSSNMAVVGTMNINSGIVKISCNPSYLYIGRDLRIQSKNIDGTFGATSGTIMGLSSGSSGYRIYVNGDFYTQSTYVDNNMFRDSNGASTFELYGNFYQIGANTTFVGSTGSSRIVFAGDQEQFVSFDRVDNKAYLGNVEIANAQNSITLLTLVYLIKMYNDATIKGNNVQINSFDINNRKVIIDGDYTIIGAIGNNTASSITVTGNTFVKGTCSWYGKFNVENDMIIDTNGVFKLANNNVATLLVEGNLRIQSKKLDGTYGDTNGAITGIYNSGGSGYKIIVYGNFYTQSTFVSGSNNNNIFQDSSGTSTLELHGNFYQIGANTMFTGSTSSSTRIMFVGENEQFVSFDRNDIKAYLGNVEVANAQNSITLLTPVYLLNLYNDATIKGNNIQINSFNINNRKITIDGDYTVAGAIGNNTASSITVTGNTFVKGTCSWYGKFNVENDMIIDTNGVFKLANNNVATLLVERDLRIQSKKPDGTYGETNGAITGIYNSGGSGYKIIVYGNFYTQSTFVSGSNNNNIFQDSSGTSILELHGNFYQIGANTMFTGSTSSSTRIVFVGENEQFVSFDRNDIKAYLGNVEIANAQNSITLLTPVYLIKMHNDATIKGNNVQIYSFDINSRNVTIDGDYTVVGAIGNNTASRLTVTGDTFVKGTCSWYGMFNAKNNMVIDTNGVFKLSSNNVATLLVEGDLRIQSKKLDGTYGETNGAITGIYGSGVTSGKYKIIVYGDFYTQSTFVSGSYYNNPFQDSLGISILELHRNFYQIGANTVFMGGPGTGRIVFAGGNEQIVSFDSNSNVSLGGIIKTNPNGVISFPANKNIPSITLYSDAKISGNTVSGVININGNVAKFLDPVNVVGSISANWGLAIFDNNLTVNGTLSSINGTIIANQNLTLDTNGYISMATDANMVVIKGNFTNNSTKTQNWTKGLFEVRGDLILNNAISASQNCIVQLTGDQQNISLSDSISTYNDVRFTTLLTKNGLGDYTITRPDNGVSRTYMFSQAGIGCINCLAYHPGCTGYHYPSNGQCLVTCVHCIECRVYKTIWYNIYSGYTINTDPIINEISSRFFGGFGGNDGTYAPTGNYSHSATDMTLPSVIGDITISHTYNSLDTSTDTVLSEGFSFGYSMHIDTEIVSELVGTTIQNVTYKTVVLPKGQRWIFKQLSNGNFEALDSRGVLTSVNGGGYELKTIDQMTYIFNQNGAIISISNNKDNTISINTGVNRRVESVTDASGTNIIFNYNGNNKLVNAQWLDNSNAVISSSIYSYDGNGRLSSVTDMGGRVATYLYNNEGLLSEVKNNLNQTTAQMTYYTSGDNEGKIQTETDIAGNIKTYTYYPADFKTVINDSNGHETTQYYDREMSITGEKNAENMTESVSYLLSGGKNKYNDVQTVTDIHGNTTNYTYDSEGNITNVQNPDGGYTTYTYDSYNNKISETNPEAGVTWYIYDDYGENLMRAACVVSGTPSRPSTVAAFDTAYANSPSTYEVTKYTYYPDNTYNRKGLVHTETGPMGDNNNYIEYTYYNFGGVNTKKVWINGVGYTTTYQYDSLRRVISETDPDGVVTTYAYNNSGEQIRKTVTGLEGTSITRTLYDNLGRVVQEIEPDEYNVAFDSNNGYSDSSAGTRYTYDSKGFLATKTDPEGNVTTYLNDDYGNVTKETMANTSYIRTVYDKINRPIQEYFNDHTKNTGEVLIRETSYTRAGKDFITTITEYPISNGTPPITIEKYDYANRLIEHIASDGIITTKTYDKNGNIKTEGTTAGEKTTYTVDKWGRITTRTTRFEDSGDAVTTYLYDKNGNITKESIKNNRSGQTATNRVTDYRNDSWGNVMAVIYNDGSNPANYIISKYDWAGRIIEQYKGLNGSEVNSTTLAITANASDYSQLNYEYDYMGNVKEVIDALENSEIMSYYKSGFLHTMTDRNGTVHTVVYDKNSNPLTKTSVNGLETITKSYTYDSMGNLATANDGNGTITYGYDGMGNCISETEGTIVKSISYNNIGNVTCYTITEDSTTLQNVINQYDNFGRLQHVKENGSTVTTYIYSNKGRLETTEYENGTTETVKYNYAGLPTSVVNKDNAGTVLSSHTYTYYYDGNQYQKIEPAGTTTYTYDYMNRLKTAQLPDRNTSNIWL